MTRKRERPVSPRHAVQTEMDGVTYRGSYSFELGRPPMLTVESEFDTTTTSAGGAPDVLARIILGEHVRNHR